MKVDIERAELKVLSKLIDTDTIDLIDFVAAETHETRIPELAEETEQLRQRIKAAGLAEKVRLDWP
jgi:hypothetical protein